MSNIIGLIVFGIIVGFFVFLFLYLNRTQHIETGAEFARERGWQFEDRLPQFGQAQRQHVFHGRNPDGIEWELTIHLEQATTQAVPTASTIWKTVQIHSEYGIVLIGPKLDQFFDTLDLSHPIVALFFQKILGDEAEQIPDLKRVPIEGQHHLTVLAVNSEYAKNIANSEVLGSYRNWREMYKKDEHFPILFLGEKGLQFKVDEVFTKAADVDVFVNFCLNVAALIKKNIFNLTA